MQSKKIRKFTVNAKQQKAKYNSVLTWYDREKKHQLCEMCGIRASHAVLTYGTLVELCEECSITLRILLELEW